MNSQPMAVSFLEISDVFDRRRLVGAHIDCGAIEWIDAEPAPFAVIILMPAATRGMVVIVERKPL
ncbi:MULTISPECIES: hypothetical protein [unclassified Sphingopyxis]|uniref:hypothetical protein n=1 Tax=unclassified Sphingopyxis TaxID=2614943 RepID=UPI0012E3DBFA|nr:MULTISPECIES: hypothetical protein [unclassified Sphingopyxis]